MLRVLEIGAGTGGTAAHLLPILPAAQAEYVYTDISGHFLAKAREKFASYPFVVYRTLDIETDPSSQGFADGQFDLVCVSLFLHHFPEEEGVRLLRGLARVCRGVILVNDLARHLVPWAFIAVAARLTRRHPMFVHDAPLSVLRGFTRSELLSIAERAGLREIRVRARWPFRLVLTARPAAA